MQSRTDAIVDIQDPEAIFVQIVPRGHWGQIMLETATDVGFLIIDPIAREIRVEGGRERSRIPDRSILGCEVGEINYPSAS
jgi:hypothetical protein